MPHTAEMRLARKTKSLLVFQMLWSWPYYFDYRRIALYGIDYLMEQKKKIMITPGNKEMTDDVIRLREEISEQYRALNDLKQMLLMVSIFSSCCKCARSNPMVIL